MEKIRAGEIVINSIDNDGLKKGFHLALVKRIRKSISVPLSVLVGAGSLHDIGQLINKYGAKNAAAGSLFVLELSKKETKKLLGSEKCLKTKHY